MKNFNFNIPTKAIFGKGRISEIGEHLKPFPGRVLIVTDKTIAQKTDAVGKLKSNIGSDILIFDAIEENPSFESVRKGALFAVDNGAKVVIGVGGGSPMDAAKGIAMLAVNNGDLSDILSRKPLENVPLPIICIPTTSGTGSEVTPYLVFTDRENGNKVGYGNPSIFPKFSIIDPELTYSMPENVIVNTGLDALTHSIEAFLSIDSYQMNDILALQSIETVIANLSKAKTKDTCAMDAMAYASMLGGITITNAGTILLHIMAYPLTVFHNIPHGLANGILLPEFMNYMKAKSTVREQVAHLEGKFKHFGGVKSFIEEGLGISTRLADYGIEESEFGKFASRTIIKGDIKITPAPVTEQDIIEIYSCAF